jgi:hypothetical protein
MLPILLAAAILSIDGHTTADRGKGVVALASQFASDTLVVLSQPNVGAPPVARLAFTVLGSSYEYTLAVEQKDVVQNAIAFAYEEVGLPYDSLDIKRGWARVIYGHRTEARGGEPLIGWVRLEGGRTMHRDWVDLFYTVPLFFKDGLEPAFFDEPDGPPATDFAPEPGEAEGSLDYAMYALETKGAWMRVRVVTPSDECAKPDRPKKIELWIRYLDEGGRPLVWFHTRGC